MPCCVQALHRNHAAPSGCYISGDPSIGFTMHLRAIDATAAEVSKLHRFTSLCNAGASVIARGAQASTMLAQTPGPLQQGSPANSGSPSVWLSSAV